MKQRVGKVVLLGTLTSFASSILLGAYGSHSIEWTRQFGTPADEVADSIAIDGQGNAWVAGTTTGALPDQLSAGSWGASVLQVQSLSLSFLPLGERPCTE
ncbi:SBBP repeat-containing protein [Synechococcus sp. R55.3]|uniref:SBBP repeat-containing protein n=1 Tax=unclassified Synechococcus TaxID=2626047 RepID=UPI0039C1153D